MITSTHSKIQTMLSYGFSKNRNVFREELIMILYGDLRFWLTNVYKKLMYLKIELILQLMTPITLHDSMILQCRHGASGLNLIITHTTLTICNF